MAEEYKVGMVAQLLGGGQAQVKVKGKLSALFSTPRAQPEPTVALGDLKTNSSKKVRVVLPNPDG
jgi:hypothetical protein